MADLTRLMNPTSDDEIEPQPYQTPAMERAMEQQMEQEIEQLMEEQQMEQQMEQELQQELQDDDYHEDDDNNDDDEKSLSEPPKADDDDMEDNLMKNFEKIKTHFPAARIKKIMQSDEDIGKVAQATPIIVGRALECFMINLLNMSIKQAKQNGVKRINATHIKSAVESTETFDFLIDAVEKYQKN